MNQKSDEPTNPDGAGKNTAKKPQGFGRKSQFDDKVKREVVLAWEQRDTSSAMTVEEFLAQKFGANADGSPVVSPQTFYGWRKKISG